MNQAESLSSIYFIIIIFHDGSFLYGKLLVMSFFTLDNIKYSIHMTSHVFVLFLSFYILFFYVFENIYFIFYNAILDSTVTIHN